MNPITMARAISLGVLAAVVAGSSGARSAAADPVADFYKGKTVQIIIGAGMGGSYGLYAQLAARHIADKIPGRPTVVVQSMPGAGGLKALAYEYNVAQKDGSVLAVPHAEVLQETVLNEKARFDAAKYGACSDAPWIELTLPSLSDPSLVTVGTHVISAYVQYAPYHLRGTTWDAERDRLGAIATHTIAKYAPGFESTVVAREVITPLDLERTYGLTGGHIFHGEIALDQYFVTRPLLGWARYETPIRQLFLCGSGTHPGTGLNGRSGAIAAKAIARALARA